MRSVRLVFSFLLCSLRISSKSAGDGRAPRPRIPASLQWSVYVTVKKILVVLLTYCANGRKEIVSMSRNEYFC